MSVLKRREGQPEAAMGQAKMRERSRGISAPLFYAVAPTLDQEPAEEIPEGQPGGGRGIGGQPGRRSLRRGRACRSFRLPLDRRPECGRRLPGGGDDHEGAASVASGGPHAAPGAAGAPRLGRGYGALVRRQAAGQWQCERDGSTLGRAQRRISANAAGRAPLHAVGHHGPERRGGQRAALRP